MGGAGRLFGVGSEIRALRGSARDAVRRNRRPGRRGQRRRGGSVPSPLGARRGRRRWRPRRRKLGRSRGRERQRCAGDRHRPAGRGGWRLRSSWAATRLGGFTCPPWVARRAVVRHLGARPLQDARSWGRTGGRSCGASSPLVWSSAGDSGEPPGRSAPAPSESRVAVVPVRAMPPSGLPGAGAGLINLGGLRLPFPATHVGLRWQGSEADLVEICWQVAGEWGAWRRLSIWHDAGDHDARIVAAGLVRPAPGATRLGVRWSAGATGLEAVVIEAASGPAPVPVVYHPAPQPEVITRAGWGADEGMRKGQSAVRPDLEAGRPPHGDAERRPRPGPDRAGGLRLPHPPQRLERHRLQLPRRPAGAGLRRSLGPGLPAG